MTGAKSAGEGFRKPVNLTTKIPGRGWLDTAAPFLFAICRTGDDRVSQLDFGPEGKSDLVIQVIDQRRDELVAPEALTIML